MAPERRGPTSDCALSLRMPVGSPSDLRERSRRRRTSRVRFVTPAALERGAVGQRHVPVEPVHPDGMIRRGRVDPSRVGQLTSPQPVIPVAAGNPRARGNGRGEVPDAPDEFVRRLRVAQLNRRQPESAIDEVHVRVDETRHDEATACVHDSALCARPRISPVVPTAITRSPATARPSAHGRDGSPVHTLALTTASVALAARSSEDRRTPPMYVAVATNTNSGPKRTTMDLLVVPQLRMEKVITCRPAHSYGKWRVLKVNDSRAVLQRSTPRCGPSGC